MDARSQPQQDEELEPNIKSPLPYLTIGDVDAINGDTIWDFVQKQFEAIDLFGDKRRGQILISSYALKLAKMQYFTKSYV
ncbi:hypothetical protein V498_07862, partial [Pseudogymnoascus sp. VKM F-4517 (FW-2822)]